MCEMMGTEPVELPAENHQIPLEVQQAFGVYRMLRDEWDTMGGNYLGKTLIGIKDLLEAAEIDASEHKLTIMLIRMIDAVRSDEINKKLREKPAA